MSTKTIPYPEAGEADLCAIDAEALAALYTSASSTAAMSCLLGPLRAEICRRWMAAQPVTRCTMGLALTVTPVEAGAGFNPHHLGA